MTAAHNNPSVHVRRLGRPQFSKTLQIDVPRRGLYNSRTFIFFFATLFYSFPGELLDQKKKNNFCFFILSLRLVESYGFLFRMIPGTEREMCQTTISGIDDMNEISSTSHKKTAKLIEPRKVSRPFLLDRTVIQDFTRLD